MAPNVGKWQISIPQGAKNLWTDFDETWHGWLCPRPHPAQRRWSGRICDLSHLWVYFLSIRGLLLGWTRKNESEISPTLPYRRKVRNLALIFEPSQHLKRASFSKRNKTSEIWNCIESADDWPVFSNLVLFGPLNSENKWLRIRPHAVVARSLCDSWATCLVSYTQWTIKTWHFIFDYNFGQS